MWSRGVSYTLRAIGGLGAFAALALSLNACAGQRYKTLACEPPGSELGSPTAAPFVGHSLDAAPDRIGDGWEVSTLRAEGFHTGPINEMLRAVKAGDYTKLDSILIARNGKLVLEAYFNGFDRETKHDTRSAFKSFTSALVGIAIDRGVIAGVDEPISQYFPDYWPGIETDPDKKARITLAHLLTMTGGFDAEENWGIGPYREDDMVASPDWVEYSLNLWMAHEPGTQFSYNSSTSFLLGAVVAQASGQAVPAFARENLFQPLGITDYCWSLTRNGRAVTQGNFYIRPRDMLKFGQLYLNRGTWEGRQIVSEEWVTESTRYHVDSRLPFGRRNGKDRRGYGYQWWNGTATNSRFDWYMASGNGGQKIFVFPKMDMVVVFNGSHYGKSIGHEQPSDLINRFIAPAALGAANPSG